MTAKRIATTMLALLLLVISTGCSASGSNAIATYNGGDLTAGIYIFCQLKASDDASIETGIYGTDLLKEEIDGQNAETWIKERAKYYLKVYAAVESECKRLDVTLTAEEQASLRENLDQTWLSYGSTFEKMGVSQNTYISMLENSIKEQKLFHAYYGIGGEHEIPESDILKFFNENYRRVIMVGVSRVNAEGIPYEGEELAQIEAVIDDYYKRAQAGEPVFNLLVEEDQRQHDIMGEQLTHTHGDIIESEQDIIVYKNSPNYNPDFIDNVFSASGINKPVKYDHATGATILECIDLMGDGTEYAGARAELLVAMKIDVFEDEISNIDTGISLNETEINKYKIATVLAEG